MIQSTPLINIGKPTVQRAKTGKIIHYKDFPKVARRIGKATGGKNGRMPYFFQFSKNGRRESERDKKYAEPNNSTMNRICKAFEDIGNINMNFAGVAPFNWQMLLSGPCNENKPEIPLMFCDLDSRNVSSEIMALDESYSLERSLINGNMMAAEDIERIFVKKYGSLEAVYPYIVKYLFGGEGINRSAHKQMFWRVFGNIALNTLKENLKSCTVCKNCYVRVPKWVNKHVCIKNAQGFFECIDCGAIEQRANSRQYRCPMCQEQHRSLQKKIDMARRRKKRRDDDVERIMRLRLSSTET